MAAMRSSPTEGTGALPAGPLGRSNSLLIPLSLAKRSNNDIAMTRGGRRDVASQ